MSTFQALSATAAEMYFHHQLILLFIPLAMIKIDKHTILLECTIRDGVRVLELHSF